MTKALRNFYQWLWIKFPPWPDSTITVVRRIGGFTSISRPGGYRRAMLVDANNKKDIVGWQLSDHDIRVLNDHYNKYSCGASPLPECPLTKEVGDEQNDRNLKDDMESDAKHFDVQPFNGKTVAEYFGKQGAAIAALANIVRSTLEVSNETKV